MAVTETGELKSGCINQNGNKTGLEYATKKGPGKNPLAQPLNGGVNDLLTGIHTAADNVAFSIIAFCQFDISSFVFGFLTFWI